MLDEAFLLWLHMLGFMTMFATSLGQLYLFTPRIQAGNIRLMLMLGAMVLFAGVLVLVTGALLWLEAIREGQNYSANVLFLVKTGAYLGVMAAGSFVTWRLSQARRWSDQLREQQTLSLPLWIKSMLLAQLVVLVVLPLIGILVLPG